MARLVPVAAVIALVAIPPAFAEGDSKRLIVGAGSKSCEMWTQHREEPATSEDRAVMEIWFQGFMSGLNMDKSTPEMLNVEYKGMTSWMDRYCRSNPLEAIASAALALALELRSRARRN